MPFPEFFNAVLCEEVRSETRGLSTLLGFYGVLPNVEVIVGNFGLPVRLGFLFLGGRGDGQHQVRVRIRTSQGKEVLASPEFTVPIEPGKRVSIALALVPGPVLPGPDTYVVELLRGNEVAYTSSFPVRAPQPGELPIG